jgi:hypothetical protein
VFKGWRRVHRNHISFFWIIWGDDGQENHDHYGGQEKKGDPTMFFQISVNRAGVISGAYTSVITGDQRPIAGQVDKTTQRVAWRIGENTGTLFETSLANLTQDVSPVAIHFGKTHTQVWLLVRMPEPAPGDQSQQLPAAPKTPPPLGNPRA